MEKVGGNQKYVFLDRDGVINQDSPDYIKSCDEFNFLKGSPEGIKMLNDAGFKVIVITNQSVINRQMVTEEGLSDIFDKMKKGVRDAGGEITDIFYCPHIPEDNCLCRKPRPGLILKAGETYDIQLENTCMVGDSAKDIEAARAAGCGTAVLVRTGNGRKAIGVLEEKGVFPDYVADDLFDAARWIVLNSDKATLKTA